MHQVRSCGVLLFRQQPELGFLLLRHPHRYDLPKGHVDEGESDHACALRELEEETGIAAAKVRLDDTFRFEHVYYPRYRRYGGEHVRKTVVVFLGWLDEEVPIRVSEHEGHEWIPWPPPPRRFGTGTIDELVAAVTRWGVSRGLLPAPPVPPPAR